MSTRTQAHRVTRDSKAHERSQNYGEISVWRETQSMVDGRARYTRIHLNHLSSKTSSAATRNWFLLSVLLSLLLCFILIQSIVLCVVFGGSHTHTLTLGLPTTSMNIKEPNDKKTTKRASERTCMSEWERDKRSKHKTQEQTPNHPNSWRQSNEKISTHESHETLRIYRE